MLRTGLLHVGRTPCWTRKAFGGEERKSQACIPLPPLLRSSPQIPACFVLSTRGQLGQVTHKVGSHKKATVSHAHNLEPVSPSARPPRSCSTHFTPHFTDSHQECNQPATSATTERAPECQTPHQTVSSLIKSVQMLPDCSQLSHVVSTIVSAMSQMRKLRLRVR